MVKEYYHPPAIQPAQKRNILQPLITQSLPQFKVWDKVNNSKQVKIPPRACPKAHSPVRALKETALHTYILQA